MPNHWQTIFANKIADSVSAVTNDRLSCDA
ncbi:hypothetical protein AB0H34_37670 [Saccharopolyspora shandongensis]